MTAQIRTTQGSECGEGGAAPSDAKTEAAASTRAANVPAASPTEPSYERVDLDRYVVLHDGPIGYVEAVAPLFVCYVGHPYPRAVEVAQVHDFHHAVRIVEIAATSAAPKITG